MHRTRCPGNVGTIKSLALPRLRFLGVDLDAGATPQAYKKAWLKRWGPRAHPARRASVSWLERARLLARGPIRAGQASRSGSRWPLRRWLKALPALRLGELPANQGRKPAGVRPITGGDRVRPVALRSSGWSASSSAVRERRPSGPRALRSPPLRPRPSAAPRHARRCWVLVPGPPPSRPPEAAPTAQSQRDGGSHGAGARQPSPGRCHVQLRRRRRLSGAGHPDSHAGGARTASPAAGGTWTEGVRGCGKGRGGRSRCQAELTLGCEQRCRAEAGVGVGPRAAPEEPCSPAHPAPTHHPTPPHPRNAPGVSSLPQAAPGPPIPLLPGFTASRVGTPIPMSHLTYWRREGRPWEGALGAPRDDSVS